MLRFLRLPNNFRFYSIKHATKQPSKYTNTINLPKTKFPQRLTASKRTETERKLLETTFAAAYEYQEAHKKEPTFILHDGPPYANGDLHVGHAVNKILKDITIRHHVARGHKVNYIPGWDCHGLPIELKAMTSKSSASKSAEKPDALSIRKKCRQFALDAIARQKDEFRSWGILSNWSDPNNIYLTFKPEFIKNQLELFLMLYESGLVYRDLKPVYWSPSSQSALAEAELEYDENFVSPSVYVRFAMQNLEFGGVAVYALVWTTTPWTLPSNQAICYNPELEYSLVRLSEASDELYLIATKLIQSFEEATQRKCEIVHRLNGSQLGDCLYQHPINKEQMDLPFYAASHVHDTKGTGLVHTAPAHGPEDFLVSLEQKIPVKCFVNESGVYSDEAPNFLVGHSVLDKGDALVLQHIADNVVYEGKFTHSYPIDWRTKKPVIIRASEQWFINTDKLKEKAVEEIGKVNIYPQVNSEASKKTLIQQVRKRPYWCISRQRVWGVPIPVFYDKSNNNAVVTNKAIIQHICDMIDKQGGNIDFWWSQNVDEILPAGLRTGHGQLTKGMDIFDIWFDSGSTWSQVMKGTQVADLYLEGYDQFTGWFQSSILTSVAARDCAPYKGIFVHGFTVDERGYKMSKSLGNIIAPQDITLKYGVDVLRWWVAAHGTQNMSITVSEKLLQQASESVSKIRATLRYLNGVVGERDQQRDRDVKAGTFEKQLSYLNNYLLNALVGFDKEIATHYSNYEYNRVIAGIQNFVANDISSMYVHLIKDRLYCGTREQCSEIRAVLSECYEILCKALWPVTPFLVEESWQHYDSSSPFHTTNVEASPDWENAHVQAHMLTAFEVKRLINQKTVENSWTQAVHIQCGDPLRLGQLQEMHGPLDTAITNSELCEILQVHSVRLSAAQLNIDMTVDLESLKVILCPRCRRFTAEGEDCVCERCAEVMSGH